MGRLTILLLGVLAAVNALPYTSPNPHAKVKRQVDELRDSYDFVVIGGGTAGLTVADRLTEAFPDRSSSLPPSFPPLHFKDVWHSNELATQAKPLSSSTA